MTPDPERMERLRALGLSEYASRAYIALLQLGETEARDVSRLARIPLAKVYQTLDRLQEQGLVRMTPSTPRRYAPMPMGEFLAKLREQRLQEARELQHVAPEMDAMFPVVENAVLADRGAIRVFKGRAESLHEMRSAIARAHHEILFSPADGWALRYAHDRSPFAEAHARGIHLRMLAPRHAQGDGMGARFADVARVRQRTDGLPAESSVGIIICDEDRAVVSHFVPDDASTSSGKDTGLLVEQEAIVAALRSNVEARWITGIPSHKGGRETDVRALLRDE